MSNVASLVFRYTLYENGPRGETDPSYEIERTEEEGMFVGDVCKYRCATQYFGLVLDFVRGRGIVYLQSVCQALGSSRGGGIVVDER